MLNNKQLVGMGIDIVTVIVILCGDRNMSGIEWTQKVWNPVTGCSKVSPGCKNCYAERMSKRLKAMGVEAYKDGFEVRTHEDRLKMPMKWNSPRLVFVNSMSDLFHEKVSDEFKFQVFKTMMSCDQHTYQILTKRPAEMADFITDFLYDPRSGFTDDNRILPQHIWLGVSIESDNFKHRIYSLLRAKCISRFLSCEPLLGPISDMPFTMDYGDTGIDWVIVGGESGPGSRPIREEWVYDIQDQCRIAGVPFFFKQWGGTNKKKAGNLLGGVKCMEVPESLQRFFT